MAVPQDENFLETYQQRIAEIQDASDVIAVANLQLNKLLQKFGWSRRSFQEKDEVVLCPVTKDHEVKQERFHDHVRICTLRKNGINSVTKKDLIPSSSTFCYEKTNIVSVKLEKSAYIKLGIEVPEGCSTTKEDKNVRKENLERIEDSCVESLIEDRVEIIQYQPCDSLDELRFIYSWNKIPPKYFHPDIGNIPYETMKQWLHENIPGAVDTGNENKQSLVNFVINHLKDMDQPDEMTKRLSPALKSKTRQFVLKIWKFVCAKRLCFQSCIPEHTRNEFDFYGTTILSTKAENTLALKKEEFDEFSLLTNDWSFFQLSKDDRLKIYEEVRKIGKVVCQDEAIKFDELKAQAEEQVKVITDFELKDKGEKTHLEVMAELRDYKRRRLSYRGKNKESRKMSGIEILRELVDQQMMYLKILYQQTREATTLNCKQDGNEDALLVVKSNMDIVEKKQDRYHRQNSREHHINKNRNRSGDRDRSDDRDRSRDRHRSRDRNRDRSRSRDRDSHRRKSRSKSRERHRRHNSRERRRSGRSKRNDSKERPSHKPHRQMNKEMRKNEISNVTYYSSNGKEE